MDCWFDHGPRSHMQYRTDLVISSIICLPASCTCFPHCHHLNTAYPIELACQAPLPLAAALRCCCCLNFPQLHSLNHHNTTITTPSSQHQPRLHRNTDHDTNTHNHGITRALSSSPLLAHFPTRLTKLAASPAKSSRAPRSTSASTSSASPQCSPSWWPRSSPSTAAGTMLPPSPSWQDSLLRALR